MPSCKAKNQEYFMCCKILYRAGLQKALPDGLQRLINTGSKPRRKIPAGGFCLRPPPDTFFVLKCRNACYIIGGILGLV